MCFLWWGHKYKIIKYTKVYHTFGNLQDYYTTIITSICEKCGKIKQKELIGSFSDVYIKNIIINNIKIKQNWSKK